MGRIPDHGADNHAHAQTDQRGADQRRVPDPVREPLALGGVDGEAAFLVEMLDLQPDQLAQIVEIPQHPLGDIGIGFRRIHRQGGREGVDLAEIGLDVLLLGLVTQQALEWSAFRHAALNPRPREHRGRRQSWQWKLGRASGL
jgi:hypothetical protein